MEEGETITAMFTHSTHITNGLKALGREYSMENNVHKVLHSLLASWLAKSTAIEEAKDLSKVTFDELIGSLMTYEIKKKNATAEAKAPKKATGIALKAGKKKELVEEEKNDDDEVTLLTRRFRNFLMNKRGRRKNEKRESSIRCYNCKKIRHCMVDCPLFKTKGNNQQGDKKKFKAMNATEWDELDGTSTDKKIEEEVANFCLMADEQSEVCVYVCVSGSRLVVIKMGDRSSGGVDAGECSPEGICCEGEDRIWGAAGVGWPRTPAGLPELMTGLGTATTNR
ncbi:uncharacterized protein LOC131163401 [Malania oleifera]|uniref:uncharacterized protein LOC131163401 n=1 Tax=Malania oleifera TaxID=397392 RepID=UPI0025AECA72|nr:uncharacterized protein LOC131163401 [Malania oleifera]